MQTNFLLFFEKALNHYLLLDPEFLDRLKPFNNNILEIKLLGISLVFYLVMTSKNIKLKKYISDTPQVIIQGTPLALLSMFFSSQRKQFFSDDVSIEGDLELGQQIISLFNRLEIDWEELLSKKIGDMPAYQIGRLIRGTQQWCQQTKKVFAQNINDYFHEEKAWFPPKELLQEFFQDVDLLRIDVDRLEAKINQLYPNKNNENNQ